MFHTFKMPWYLGVPWTESIKKRACRYLLQRYLGQFLEEKLTLDQLTVDLYNGTGTVSEVRLDVQVRNTFYNYVIFIYYTYNTNGMLGTGRLRHNSHCAISHINIYVHFFLVFFVMQQCCALKGIEKYFTALQWFRKMKAKL